MNKERAAELNAKVDMAIEGEICDGENSDLILARIHRDLSRWDGFSMYYWKARRYLKMNNIKRPRMWLIGFIWMNSAFKFLFGMTRWQQPEKYSKP